MTSSERIHLDGDLRCLARTCRHLLSLISSMKGSVDSLVLAVTCCLSEASST
ncbi:unnamed protein product [Gongylonema pulchrum]|uniref:Uncharacterized protein n=1 Tax=Gongylonema pulchrum TaxID=637853 RepID=A0A3P7PPV6_9BILA|nr:unnamed protein product [Gongylonema pulchrum]